MHPFGVVWINFADELQFPLLGSVYLCACAVTDSRLLGHIWVGCTIQPQGLQYSPFLDWNIPCHFLLRWLRQSGKKRGLRYELCLPSFRADYLPGPFKHRPVSRWSQEQASKEAKRDGNGIIHVLYLCSQAIVPVELKRKCLTESFLYISCWMCVVSLRWLCVCMCVFLMSSAIGPGDSLRRGFYEGPFSNGAIRQLSKLCSGPCTVGSFL